MNLSRKGFVYMTIVIIFLMIMVFMFYTYEIYKVGSSDNSIYTRIVSMDNFIDNLNRDASNAVYIASYRSLLAMEEYTSMTGSYLIDTESVFREAFFNGTIGNYTSEILNQSSFSLYVRRVNEKSRDMGIELDVGVRGVSLEHIDPWNLWVEVYISVNVTDTKGLASWNFNESIGSQVSLFGLKDSLYSVETKGRLQSFIRKTNITEFVVNNDTSNLQTHIEQGYYKESTSAPSFLMRFEGNFSDSPYGVESIVNIDLLEKQEDIDVDYTKTVIDYLYFGNQTTNDRCNVEDMPSWFRIDVPHLDDYEVDEINYTTC